MQLHVCANTHLVIEGDSHGGDGGSDPNEATSGSFGGVIGGNIPARIGEQVSKK